MNIGTLIRGLLGDNKPGAAKSLELKEGQVVRGVVLSVSDSGKEAVVQIQGTPVRAELETPLLLRRDPELTGWSTRRRRIARIEAGLPRRNGISHPAKHGRGIGIAWAY